MTSFASIIKSAEKDFAAITERHCLRLEADLAAAGAPSDLIRYEVARFRQAGQADTARRIAAARRDWFSLVRENEDEAPSP